MSDTVQTRYRAGRGARKGLKSALSGPLVEDMPLIGVVKSAKDSIIWSNCFVPPMMAAGWGADA